MKREPGRCRRRDPGLRPEAVPAGQKLWELEAVGFKGSGGGGMGGVSPEVARGEPPDPVTGGWGRAAH